MRLHNPPIDMMSGDWRHASARRSHGSTTRCCCHQLQRGRPPRDRLPTAGRTTDQTRSPSDTLLASGASPQSRAPAMRPLVGVHEVCKKVPFCQRAANHPGLCKTPTVCHLLIRCTRPFRHTGAQSRLRASRMRGAGAMGPLRRVQDRGADWDRYDAALGPESLNADQPVVAAASAQPRRGKAAASSDVAACRRRLRWWCRPRRTCSATWPRTTA